MIREVERNSPNENFYNAQSEKVLSPMENRFAHHAFTTSQKTSDNHNINCNIDQNYSPFVIKKSFNLQKSTSSAGSKSFITNEKSAQNSKIYSPSPNNIKKERLSDRFIPINKRVNLLEKFELAKKWDANNDKLNLEGQIDDDIPQSTRGHGNNSTYSHLLENNFFSNDNNEYYSNNIPITKNELILGPIHRNESSLIKSKIFSFKKEQKRKDYLIGLFL
jgi:hypothetical protein